MFNPANVGSSFTVENLAPPVTLAIGDTLDLTVTFGGQRVSIDNESYLWPLLLTGVSDTLGTTGTIEFFGAQGPLANTAPLSQTNQFVHIGQYTFSNLYRTGAGAISFTGFRHLVTIDSGSVASRDYQQLAIMTDGIVSVSAAGVPEPATLALMILGMGAVAGATRHRRRATAVRFA